MHGLRIALLVLAVVGAPCLAHHGVAPHYDATKPVQRPYEARVAVPKAAMEKTHLEDFIPRALLDRVPKV